MIRVYASLWDSKYCAQGLAMYESLRRHSSEQFRLFVLALDSQTVETLEALKVSGQCDRLEIVRLSWMGVEELQRDRTWQEFCWTMASAFTDEVMQHFTHKVPNVTYLDADLMFFSDPKVIFDEIGDRSVAVIPHRWNEKDRKRLEPNGQFNVSWVTFKNNAIGRECLSTWARQCRERCSAKVGCGDQKYLDEWPAKYGSELCVIQNIGAGVAPWNLQNYEVSPGPKVDGVPVVFYHYHEFKEMTAPGDHTWNFRLTNYEISDTARALIYDPYVSAYVQAKERIASVHIPA